MDNVFKKIDKKKNKKPSVIIASTIKGKGGLLYGKSRKMASQSS